MMSVGTAVDLIVYGVLMAVLSLVAGRFSTENSSLLISLGVGGGSLVLLWAVLSLRGISCRGWVILTLVIISIAMAAFVVSEWLAVNEDKSETRNAALIATLLLVFSVGQLILLTRERDTTPKDS